MKTLYSFLHRNRIAFFLGFKKKYSSHSFLALFVLFPNADFCLAASFSLISIGSML